MKTTSNRYSKSELGYPFKPEYQLCTNSNWNKSGKLKIYENSRYPFEFYIGIWVSIINYVDTFNKMKNKLLGRFHNNICESTW